jgi:regulator of replication initiation timing
MPKKKIRQKDIANRVEAIEKRLGEILSTMQELRQEQQNLEAELTLLRSECRHKMLRMRNAFVLGTKQCKKCKVVIGPI